ncbi:DUF4189 domain-containing protein [Dyella tabacisoli]|uniref:DUF4189 domain-containing protein n=1 Tax=Dyella tabacisoli TaxID=2282381 RepID=A0A369UKY3_9GAMM|nr:DUF4189 domain-containing protein [Dyella tabacisoli]RDD80983.1 DUF4189 domain-containing protein [Dyella tabacisoli]
MWAAAGYGSDAAAQNTALDACTQTMGEGCEVGAAWSNLSEIVVIEDAAGNLFVKGGPGLGNAEKAAREECELYTAGCHTTANVINSLIGTRTNFPVGPLHRRLFASIARPKGTPDPKWDDMAWLASGQSGFKAAEQAALSQCGRDTDVECEVRVTVGNSQIARTTDDQGHISWLNIAAPEALDRQLRAHCAKGRECRLLDTFDARTPRTLAIEISKSDAPARGFFSLARPIDDATEKTWGKRALVTGSTSREAAQTAAVGLCETESKSRCEAVPKDGDRGVDQFFVLIRDAAGEAKLFMRMSAAEAQLAKDQFCAKEGQQCPKGLTVDLAKPTTTILKI